MFNKSFLIGITVGLICVSLIARDIYIRLNSPSESLVTRSEVLEPTPISSDNEVVVEIEPSPSTSIINPSFKPATPKPSTKVIIVSTPTPTPKPLIDYYIQAHSQILVPENTANVTEFVESKVYPRMRLEVDFAVNNAKVGDTVELKIYDDGNLQTTQSRQVSSTTNFHFAEVFYALAHSAGNHSVRFVFNENRSVAESNYGNNEYTFTYKITGETVPPTFTLDGPYLINGQTCMRWINLEDNFSVYTDVWGKYKFDNQDWSKNTSENPYDCITGVSGSSHTYYVHAEDLRGNVREDSRAFTIF